MDFYIYCCLFVGGEMIDPRHGWNVSFKPLIWGFVLSLVLILAAYFIVVEHLLTGWVLLTSAVVLGIIQGLVQLIFFLHLGIESKPRWNLMIFMFMVLIIIIINGGSMWIINNLDYNVM